MIRCEGARQGRGGQKRSTFSAPRNARRWGVSRTLDKTKTHEEGRGGVEAEEEEEEEEESLFKANEEGTSLGGDSY